MLALGREDSNTTDLLNAKNGNLIRSLTASHNWTNEAVFTLDDQHLINGNGSSGETCTLGCGELNFGFSRRNTLTNTLTS